MTIPKRIFIDVDGCLTSGVVTYSEEGERTKSFHSRDITAIKRIKEMGFEVTLLTQSTWGGIKYFAKRCGCEYHKGIMNKGDFVRAIGVERYIAVADDTGDLSFLRDAELSFVPNDGIVSSCYTHKLVTRGGEGVMAEIYNILESELTTKTIEDE